jgi:S1-C subfamily serine protease
MNRAVVAFSVLSVLGAVASTARADEQLYQRVVRSTVWIQPDESMGSGVLVDAERKLVATAWHVVEGAKEVTVRFPDFDEGGVVITGADHYRRNRKAEIPGRVLRIRNRGDVALIQLERVPEGVAPIPRAKTPVRIGQNVHLVGNSDHSLGALFGYSDGKVRNAYENDDGAVIETSIPSNKGDSGGPVVNDAGELVALISQGTTGSPVPAGSPLHAKQVVDISVSVKMLEDLLVRSEAPDAEAAESGGGGGRSRAGVDGYDKPFDTLFNGRRKK